MRRRGRSAGGKFAQETGKTRKSEKNLKKSEKIFFFFPIFMIREDFSGCCGRD